MACRAQLQIKVQMDLIRKLIHAVMNLFALKVYFGVETVYTSGLFNTPNLV